MRLIRIVVPAIVAVLAWCASDALARIAFASESQRVRRVLGMIAPDTMTIAVDAPAPWGTLLWFAVVLAIGGGFVFFSALLGPARNRRGFAAMWFGAIATAALAVAIPMAFAVLTAAFSSAALTEFGQERLATAALWGLFWGWLPALAAFLLAARNSHPAASATVSDAVDAPRPRRLLIATALIMVVGLGTAAVVEPIARDAWHAALQAEIPDEAAEPIPIGTPVPEIAPGDWQIEPLWCTDNQLEFSASRPDAALGSRTMTITATNIGQASCVLEGYPDIAFSDPVTSALDVRIEHGSRMGADDSGPVRLELTADAVATATIAWRAMSTANSGQEPAGWLHLAPYHGGIRQMLPVKTDIIGEEVVVTAWHAGEIAEPGEALD